MWKFFRKKKKNADMPETYVVPGHIAIIMDGNGRWAKKRGLSRSYGHRAGGETLRKIVYAARDLGVQYLTVYAFSTENWKRPQEEVDKIMEIFMDFFNRYQDEFSKIKCRVRFVGREEGIPADVMETIRKIEKVTETGDQIQLNVAFNYGGRQEILDAVTKMMAQEDRPPLIDEAYFKQFLYLPDVPDPDLIIRSSGEMRTSNFLMWESAYSEFWVSDILWPDFTGEDLKQAVLDYNNRHRRYGGL
jgi:undecaprenyl diphosphate synthase